jgi:trans-aconitate methyltransferase
MKQQTKQELEDWYKKNDPWSYKTTNDDIIRKEKILSLLENYDTVLDIGCGEGFITTDLPANKIYGIELSDNASLRLPNNIIRLMKPEEKYDLVMTTGTLYQQYNHQQITNWIKQSASHHILVGGIKDWMIWSDFGKIINEIEFQYREYTHIVRLYEIIT